MRAGPTRRDLWDCTTPPTPGMWVISRSARIWMHVQGSTAPLLKHSDKVYTNLYRNVAAQEKIYQLLYYYNFQTAKQDKLERKYL